VNLIIATWNIERLKHRRELPRIIELCKQISADVFVLTETDSALDLDYKHCFRTANLNDGIVKYQNTEYRVAIYTNFGFVKRHNTFNEQTAICVELLTDGYENLLVYGVVMGIYGNRHENYKTDLPLILSDIDRLASSGKRLCVCGDFNCSFSDNYYYTKDGRTALEEMFEKNSLELLTRKQSECIDHIAVSRELIGASAITVKEWNHDKKLSDHKGIFVELA
jgi:endonuclease/exonuclease/phosphatase family metal-dependent hydrolase